MLSSLSMNSMAKMPDMLEPIGRSSVWRNMRSIKVKYVLWSFTSSRSATSCLEILCIVSSILLTALLMGSWIGMDTYRDTTSRSYGYGSALLLLRSPTSRLFSRCAGTFFSMVSRALESNHEMRCVGPLTFDTIGPILMSGPVLYVLNRW